MTPPTIADLAESGKGLTWEQVHVAVLMDIRDELRMMANRVRPLQHLDCANFLAIPHKLDRLVRNTTKRRKTRKR